MHPWKRLLHLSPNLSAKFVISALTEARKIVKYIEISIEKILYFFFTKIIEPNFIIKNYKITLFYYQVKVLIGQFILIQKIKIFLVFNYLMTLLILSMIIKVVQLHYIIQIIII